MEDFSDICKCYNFTVFNNKVSLQLLSSNARNIVFRGVTRLYNITQKYYQNISIIGLNPISQTEISDLHPCESLASLDIMGVQLRTPQKPQELYSSIVSNGLRGALNQGGMIPKGVILPNSRLARCLLFGCSGDSTH